MLEDTGHRIDYSNRLHGIAQQVAHHSHRPGVRPLDQYGKVGAGIGQRAVRRVPHSFPAMNDAPGLDFDPIGVEAVATMADPLRPELPCYALRAALHQKSEEQKSDLQSL